MSLPIAAPYVFIPDAVGVPLDNGYVYIGTANQNPQTNPIQVYWDADATIPAQQPLRTSGGYFYRNGTPSNVFVSTTDYSITVRDSSQQLVYTLPSAEIGGSSPTFTNVTITNSLTVDGDTTITIDEPDQAFTIVTQDGDTFIVDSEGNTTINVAEGDEFLVTGEGDTHFQTDVIMDGNSTTFINGATIDLPDSTVTIADLSSEVLNLILSSGGGGSGGGGSIASGNGRLSLASGVSIMTIDYTGVTTVYYVGGDTLLISDGSGNFTSLTIGELSQTLADTTYSPAASAASKNYDLFGWKDTLSVTGIVRISTTATATTSAPHNLTTGAVVFVSGAAQSAYNGYHTLTGGSGSTFTFEVAGSPTTPASGTITAATARLSRGPAWRNAGQVITGATNAAPIVITAVAHGLQDGDVVNISGVGTNTAANGNWVVASAAADTFALTGSTGNGVYTAGTGALSARGVGAGTTQITLTGNTYVNSVGITNGPTLMLGTYLGTIHTNGSNQLDWKLGSVATGGGEAYLSIWNVSNAALITPVVQDLTSAWTYGSNTIIPLNNSVGWRISSVRGLDNTSTKVNLQIRADPTFFNEHTAGLSAVALIAVDSITVQGQRSTAGQISASGTGTGVGTTIQAFYNGFLGQGFHYVQALQCTAGANTKRVQYFGTDTAYTPIPVQCGLLTADLFQ